MGYLYTPRYCYISPLCFTARRKPQVRDHVTRSALRLRGDGALLHVGHQTVGGLPEAHIHQPLDRVGCKRLAPRPQQVPLPLGAPQRLGPVLQRLPALALTIIAPTGSEQMQMGVVVPMAAMGVEHHDVAPLERLAPNRALKVIQTLRPTAHERTQHDRRVLVEGGAEHRRHRQDEVPRDAPLVADLAPLADPGIDIDLRTP